MPGFLGPAVTNALLVGILATIAAVVVMNRGDRAFVNLRAQDEPVILGVGVALAAWAVMAAPPMGGVVFVVGVILVAVGIVSRYTDLVDINALFNS